MNYPSFKDYSGNVWNVVTIHIVKSSMWQIEMECQTFGIAKTKTFVFSADTGMISQYDENEVFYSAPDDTHSLCSALKQLFD